MPGGWIGFERSAHIRSKDIWQGIVVQDDEVGLTFPGVAKDWPTLRQHFGLKTLIGQVLGHQTGDIWFAKHNESFAHFLDPRIGPACDYPIPKTTLHDFAPWYASGPPPRPPKRLVRAAALCLPGNPRRSAALEDAKDPA